MTDILKIIETVGQQWPFLIVLFLIVVIIIKWNVIGQYISNISEIKLKKGENEVSVSRKIDNSKKPDTVNESVSGKEIVNSRIKRISKLESSQIFFNKLGDPNVKNIKIITYTNEVEAGQINHYKVAGKKTIEVYKRSVLADLYEQQKNNIYRVINKESFKPWNKKKLLVESTKQLEIEFASNKDVKVLHYFYDHPPTKRAYIFDDTEAIYSYYQCLDDTDGSRYKGMGELDRLWVSEETDVGKYLLGELLNEIKLLKIHSRNLLYENWLIENGSNAIYSSLITPVLNLKAVFLDMDGILYDSLWQYKIAWREAFKLKEIEISDKEVYLQEGRSGLDTIKYVYKKYRNSIPKVFEIEEIIKKRNEILLKYGKPKPQEGIFELLQEIKRCNLMIYVVTGSSKNMVKEDIVSDFSKYINPENIISGQDSKIGKPSPEPYLLALHKAHLRPTEVVVIENAPLGVEAAKSSGIFTLAVNTGILDDLELINAGSDNIFKNCLELSKKWSGIYKSLTE
jgi:beta-phosphoglucomutase-like phosphatase (HAD superfamily)